MRALSTFYRQNVPRFTRSGEVRTDADGTREGIREMSGRAPGEPGGWVQLSVEVRDGGRLVGDGAL